MTALRAYVVGGMDLSLLLIGLVGGVITGLSPCILPVLPVIFLSGGAHRRPYLVVAGLVTSFSLLTLAGAAILTALPIPPSAIRWAGLIALLLLGVGLIVPRVEALLEAPFTRAPAFAPSSRGGGLVLGLVLGTVYVPCAGPVLAAITVAGATGTVGAGTIFLTLGFAVGTAAALLVFAFAGQAVAQRVKAFRQRQRQIRVASGVVVVGLALALTFDVVGTVQRAVPDYTAALGRGFSKLLTTAPSVQSRATPSLAACEQQALYEGSASGDCGTAPSLAGISNWLNTSPVSLSSLRGKAVLVDFWTFDCINCRHVIPHINDWYRSYHDAGFEVVGVHTPEYGFEHDFGGVTKAVAKYGIKYPVAVDNDYDTWASYGVQAWPSMFLIDPNGTVRHIAIGEGGYDETEKLIRSLLPTMASQ